MLECNHRGGKKIPFASVILKEYKRINKDNFNFELYFFTKKTAEAIIELNKMNIFQEALLKRNTFHQFPDGWFYFVEKLSVSPKFPYWGGPSWIPDKMDILRSRVRTTEKQEVRFINDQVKYKMIDLGGHGGARKKVAHVLAGCDAILFVASLAEYDMVLYEDRLTNRFTETLNVWTGLVNNKEYENTWIFLLLNKTDVLKQKFCEEKKEINPDFKCEVKPPIAKEETDSEEVEKWFEDVYLSRANEETKKRIRVYFTNSLDKPTVTEVMDYISSIMKQSFATSV